MHQIALLETINEIGLNKIKKKFNVHNFTKLKRKEYLKKIDNINVIIIKGSIQIDKEFISHAPNLKAVCRAGTGLDNIDQNLLKKKKIKLFNTPRSNTISAAEFTIFQILFECRNFDTVLNKLHKKDYRRHLMNGLELRKQKIGIIGLGNIGYAVFTRLKSFGCKIYGYDINENNNLKFKKKRGNCYKK